MDLNRVKPKKPKQVLHVTLPIPISVNHIHYNTRGGGRRLTKDAEKWMSKARASVIQQIEDQGYVKEELGVWLYADVDFYFPDRRIRDNHNTFKLLFDSIEGHAFINDYYIMPRVNYCYLDKENPRIEMSIYPQKYKVIK